MWDEVQSEHARLANAASLLEGTQASLNALSEGEGAALVQLNLAADQLEALTGFDAGLKSVLELVEPARIQVQEAARELTAYLRHVELDPERLADVSARLEALHSAGRKFRMPPEELPVLFLHHTSRPLRLGN